ncbi:MAG: hypothetical protein ABI615_01045 [Chthoniobacterales bacterium]
MKQFHNKAFALPIVLWALGILFAVLVATAAFMDLSLRSDALSAKAATAKQLAISGIAFASGLKNTNLPLTLTRTVDDEGQFTIERSSETGRININILLQKKDQEAISCLLVFWGATPEKATLAASALVAQRWKKTNSASGEVFVPFNSYGEITAVPEFEAATADKKDWRDLLTFWGSGPIDLNYASQDALIALGRLSREKAQALIALRNDAEKAPNPEANHAALQSVDQVITFLGVTGEPAKQLTRYFGTKTELHRIESRAEVAKIKSHILIVVNADAKTWAPLVWSE